MSRTSTRCWSSTQFHGSLSKTLLVVCITNQLTNHLLTSIHPTSNFPCRGIKSIMAPCLHVLAGVVHLPHQRAGNSREISKMCSLSVEYAEISIIIKIIKQNYLASDGATETTGIFILYCFCAMYAINHVFLKILLNLSIKYKFFWFKTRKKSKAEKKNI